MKPTAKTGLMLLFGVILMIVLLMLAFDLPALVGMRQLGGPGLK